MITNDKIVGMLCVTALAVGLVIANYFIPEIKDNVVATVQMVITGIMGAVVGYNLSDFRKNQN